VFIFADEWPWYATGYAGDVNCETPALDALAAEGINVTHAVSGHPVCSPYRASLMTGQYPLTHGVYINDVELDPGCYSIANAFADAGYDTAYVGKWHIYGSPDGKYGRRKAFVPREYQLGFDYWKGFECTHDYNDSHYFFNDDPTPRKWEGYDAFPQSEDLAQYIRVHAGGDKPFMAMLSYGPPHFPLHTAPEEYRSRYADRDIKLRPNVPPEFHEKATEDLRGFYAHVAALDDAVASVLQSIKDAGIEDDTIVVFTSDHGDMFWSQGLETKLHPWDESIRVPFLLRWPGLHGRQARELALPLDAPDIMPTLLGLCGLPVPDTVEGRDWSPYFRNEHEPDGEEAALLNAPAEFARIRQFGFRAYRGLRTGRYTYVRNTEGPWLLFDNERDPYQMKNLLTADTPAEEVAGKLEQRLQQRLDELNDEFLDGRAYLERDGLTHYGEANAPCRQPWSDPWIRPDRSGGAE